MIQQPLLCLLYKYLFFAFLKRYGILVNFLFRFAKNIIFVLQIDLIHCLIS